MTASKKDKHRRKSHDHVQKNVFQGKKSPKKKVYRGVSLAVIALICGLVHRFHVSTLYENDGHFSHLSTLEREMMFRSEMGLYYSYFKTIVEAESFALGLDKIIHNNLTEYPSTINTLERFNVVPEVLVGGLYRMCRWLGMLERNCWWVERGNGRPPVRSCVGLKQPELFYLQGVWFCAAITMAAVFLYGVILSDSMIGGMVSVLAFLYNHGECTRVQWTPPLRESFAYPFCLLHMFVVSWCLKKSAGVEQRTSLQNYQMIAVMSTSGVCLVLWQFSQFFLTTQVLALLGMFSLGLISKTSLLTLFLGELLGVLEAVFFLFGNAMLKSSILLSLLVSAVYSLIVIYPVASKFFSSKAPFITTVCILMTTVALKKWLLISTDDDHVKNLLWSKLSDYKDFHTLLYTCSVEFDFLGWNTIRKLSDTWLIPIAVFVIVVLFFHWLFSKNKLSAVEPHLIYNVLQLAAFTIMAVFVMRLKLFFTPHLCLIISVFTSYKYFKFLFSYKIHYSLVVVSIAAMSVVGISNVMDQHKILGEFSNFPLEELLEWVQTSTPKGAVFAGTMPVTAALILSTGRPVVNHPHYEHAPLRERTKLVYSVYSRKPPDEVYRKLTSLGVDYIVLSENWCFNEGRPDGCRTTDLWDVEEPERRGEAPVCPLLAAPRPPPGFNPVFSNAQYTVLKLQPQLVQLNSLNNY